MKKIIIKNSMKKMIIRNEIRKYWIMNVINEFNFGISLIQNCVKFH